MYQYSLEYFTGRFKYCIDSADQADDTDTRIQNLISFLTLFVYNNICRGLFERDKMMFSFVMCAQILRNRGDIANSEWLRLLRGPGPVERMTQKSNPDTSFRLLSEKDWDFLHIVDDEIPAFRGITQSIVENWDKWKAWRLSEEPHRVKIPMGYETALSPFQKLLIYRAFCQHCLMFAVSDFVGECLGSAFVENPAVSMADVFEDTDCRTPCIFVLSSGADPTALLLQFAKAKGYDKRLNVISLGQGQGPRAADAIEKSSRKGDWVLLQNCHLAKSWMTDLEQIVFNLSSGAANNNFRLFLTSFPAPYFPVPVLQCSIKMTNEPPRGLRANMIRSYDLIVSESYLESVDVQPREWKK